MMMSHVEDMSYKTDVMNCHWPSLRHQLLSQWKKITPEELNEAGPSRHNIALLIQQKHGVAWELVEGYLGNIEHSLPLFG